MMRSAIPPTRNPTQVRNPMRYAPPQTNGENAIPAL